MKPLCKAEAHWLYWRNENPSHSILAGFSKWAKNQMNRSKRRLFKREIREY
jgi:hypothetical protein